MMNRRVFITGLGAVLAAPLGAGVQPSKVWRIGQLVTSGSALLLGTFRQRLGERGYFEGQNLLIENRNAEGRPERLPALATELVELRVDVIATFGTQAAFAAKEATTVIPIVMGTSGEAVGAGLVQSLARPGANITGITGSSPELSGKRLQLRSRFCGIRKPSPRPRAQEDRSGRSNVGPEATVARSSYSRGDRRWILGGHEGPS
jgi:putative ABC transport system substrate-binding protein